MATEIIKNNKPRRFIVVHMPGIEVLTDYLNSLHIISKYILLTEFNPEKFLTSNDIFIFTQMWFDPSGFPSSIYSSERFVFLNVEMLSESNRANHISRMMSYNMNIADYSVSNIDFIKKYYAQSGKIYNKSLLYLPYQYVVKEISLLRNQTHKYEFDIGVINAYPKKDSSVNSELTYKRSAVFDKLTALKFNCVNITGWGHERDLIIQKCKIILNVHHFECFTIFEHIRCDRLIFANKLVVSEKSMYMEDLDIFPFVYWSNYETIVDYTKHILDNFDSYQTQLEKMPKNDLISSRIGQLEKTYSHLQA